MFIKNKKTGLIQECHNEDVIRICKKDSEYYEVTETMLESKPEPEPVGGAADAQEPGGDSEKNLEDMTVPELKALAKEKGIEGASSLNREDLLAVLKDVI